MSALVTAFKIPIWLGFVIKGDMPTVHRKGRFRFVIYLNDHDPAHVHVFCDGREIVINLGGAGVAIRDIDPGVKRPDACEAFRIAVERRETRLQAWRTIDAQRS